MEGGGVEGGFLPRKCRKKKPPTHNQKEIKKETPEKKGNAPRKRKGKLEEKKKPNVARGFGLESRDQNEVQRY